ncbi:uncharacterized protein TOT_040000640 [Theileria orientalis strain Shintoku]|uniref:Uncharacterized protein n=1 Tax=Theileria orientalis strain Shintoku TaxID=869250 RepID=J4C4J0_THEOR|nr:uncharacterized protein TOT_040000640 [Theileria orientalis strain Shintoku]BAM42271.1 uncharacterized protein TOT_040000640 [Theileria orientalis strain Shintoku]|eukprot:XP_009692572.1 uncharacterized protein TOT_040000640 [Theileria orientalis strain Shintoku]
MRNDNGQFSEFSGINPKPDSVRTLDDYLLALKEDVEEYALLQIGFCLATYSNSSAEAKWILHPYNFYTYSSEIYNTIFLNDTLLWLRDNGFSLDRWVDEGCVSLLKGMFRVDFKRLGDMHSDSVSFITKRTRNNGLHHLIKSIIEYRIPLVFHNGMLDILHLYDKFIGPLPENPVEISREITRFFVGGIFDTKEHLTSNVIHKLEQVSSLRNKNNQYARYESNSEAVTGQSPPGIPGQGRARENTLMSRTREK